METVIIQCAVQIDFLKEKKTIEINYSVWLTTSSSSLIRDGVQWWLVL